MSIMKRVFRLSLVAGALSVAFAAVPVASQLTEGGMDSRWLPFIGCWEAVDAYDEIGLLCFSSVAGGVAVTNYVEGEVSSVELLAADGEPRQVSAEECEGWESLTFSTDGRRVFTTTDFFCGDSEVRVGTGVMSFLSPTSWADVRALDVEGQTIAWVQEYQLAGPKALREHGVEDLASGGGVMVRSARMAASAVINIDDVIEASSVMGDKAVETWVILKGDDLRVDAGDLLMLADTGVSGELIDAVVVVSNPKEFSIEVGHDVERQEIAPYPVHYRGYMSAAHYWGPDWGPGYYYGGSPYYGGYGYYGGSPYYGGYGYYDGRYRYGYWGARPGYVVVTPRRKSGGSVYRDGYRRGSDAERRRVPSRGANPEVTGSGGGASSSGSGAPVRRAKPRRRTSGEGSPQASGTPSVRLGSERAISPERGSTARRITPRPSRAELLPTASGTMQAPVSRGTARSRVPQVRSPSARSFPSVPQVSPPIRPSAARPAIGSATTGRDLTRTSGPVRRPSGSL